MRVDGDCKCDKCKCGKSGWIDAISQLCRECEAEHGQRWGVQSAYSK